MAFGGDEVPGKHEEAQRGANVTEAEWRACTSPETMLEFLRGKSSDRKLRLVACACCRRIWPLLDGWSQNAVEVAERRADGSAGQTAMAFAAALHEDVILKAKPYTARHIAAGIVNAMISGAVWPLAWNTVSEVRRAIRASSPPGDTYQEATAQAAIIRDIFGNPFRPVLCDPARFMPGVVALAQQVYDHRAFDRLPVLAVALEEAGCRDSDMLGHCRGPGPHVRGCCVVDSILGKK
jgi:hypothetical protein